jgi:hypothetical protein
MARGTNVGGSVGNLVRGEERQTLDEVAHINFRSCVSYFDFETACAPRSVYKDHARYSKRDCLKSQIHALLTASAGVRNYA